MTAESIIHHYNRLNGNSITRERLKQFHARVQSALDSNSHGTFVKDLRGILSRVAGVLKQNFDVIDRIELVPIDTNKDTGKILRVASGYDEKKAEPTTTNNKQPTNIVAEAIPLSKIHTDTKRFQNRMDAFSEASANSVAENYDPNKFDPIVIWKDPANKKLYVLSGHSRYEGMKRRNAKTIAARYFKGSEEQAIKFAKVEANRAANQESLIEDLAAYRLMRDGDESKGIKKLSKSELAKIFKGKVQKLDAYSYLSGGGLFVNALNQNTTSNYPYLERNAQWVGILRNQNAVISNAGEDNIFHYFYSDKTGRNLKQSKEEFFKLAQRKINQLGKGEGVLFPECSADGCAKVNDKETDPIKGESYKRLREVSEQLNSITEKLNSKNPNIRVTTDQEKKYLRDTAHRLQSEKEKIQRDLDVMDKSQSSLFGATTFFNVGMEMEFNNDGDIVKVVGNRKVRKRYLILYNSTKTGKKYSDTREDLLKWIDEGILKIKSQSEINGPQFDAFDIQPKKKTKGPLNALQLAQLQDAIKAGRTPKVNLKAKMNAKQKPAPLFDEPVNDPRQASLFGMKKKKSKGLHGIVSANSLAGLQFRTFELADPYKKEFYKLNSDTQAMIWGSPGHGKTVYMLNFAQYIAEKLGLKTLYIANEEFGRSTFTEKINEFKIGHQNLYFTKNLDESQVDQFDAIFFDSINSLGISLKDYKAFRDRHPGKMYVLIVQSTKEGDFRGGNDWEHEVDVAGEIRNRKIILHKNRFDKHNPEKMEKLMTTAAIEEAKKKAEIRQAVKQSQQPKKEVII